MIRSIDRLIKLDQTWKSPNNFKLCLSPFPYFLSFYSFWWHVYEAVVTNQEELIWRYLNDCIRGKGPDFCMYFSSFSLNPYNLLHPLIKNMFFVQHYTCSSASCPHFGRVSSLRSVLYYTNTTLYSDILHWWPENKSITNQTAWL